MDYPYTLEVRDVSALSRYAPGMALNRYGVTEGTRDEILAELDRLGQDRSAHDEDRARHIAAAMNTIAGEHEDAVRIGDEVYRVVGE